MHNIKINTIVTHCNPDLDEIFAFYQAAYSSKFTGLPDAKWHFVDAGTPPDRIVRRFNPQTTLFLGVGGQNNPYGFDEHGMINPDGAPAEESCSRLMALFLSDDGQSLPHDRVLNYVHRVDCNGDTRADNLSVVVKQLYNLFSVTEVIQWAVSALDAKYAEKKRNKIFEVSHIGKLIAEQQGESIAHEWRDKMVQVRLQHTLDQEQARRIVAESNVEIVMLRDRKVRVLFIENDNQQVANIAFSPKNSPLERPVDVVVLRKSSGHTIMQVRKDGKLSLVKIAGVVNMLENIMYANTLSQSISRKKVVNSFFKKLTWTISEGTMQYGRWCNYNDGMWLMNGSRSAPGAKPTLLDFDIIRYIVKKNLIQEYQKKDVPCKLHGIYRSLIETYAQLA